jgi:hypothetical protein
MTTIPDVDSTTVDEQTAQAAEHRLPAIVRTFRRREVLLYISSALVTSGLTTWALKLWHMSPSVPLRYDGDALSTAAYIKAIMQTGWYEHQPHLGAPFGQLYYDYPFADNLHLVIMGAMAFIVPKFGLIMNAYFLMGFPLAAVTATWFFRSVGIRRSFACVLAVLFALAPYHFWRGESHLFLTAYWPVPLFAVLLVRVIRGEQFWNRRLTPRGSRLTRFLTLRNLGTVVILVVAGSATQYYGVFDLVILVFVAVAGFVRTLNIRRLIGAAVGGTIIAVTLLINLLPDLIFQAQNGPNFVAAYRVPQETENYSLKLAMLLLPSPDHRLPALRALSQDYFAEFTTYTREDIGLVASAGLLFLLALLAIFAGITIRKRKTAPARHSLKVLVLGGIAGTVLWILIVGGTGGLADFFSILVTPKVRGWDRLSIYVELLALAAVGMALGVIEVRIRKRHSPRSTGITRAILPAVALLILVVGAWDQVTPDDVPNYARNLANFTEDAGYANSVQAQLPANAAVYQLPYDPFPESPGVNGFGSYDQIKLSLQTSTIRWSYGGVRGRPAADWPSTIQNLTGNALVDRVTAAGFDGISVNRDGYADHGAALERQLAANLHESPLISSAGKYSFWDLRAKDAELIRELGKSGVKNLGYETTHPLLVYPDSPGVSFGNDENAGGFNWTATESKARLIIETNSTRIRRVRIRFEINYAPGSISSLTVRGGPSSKTIDVAKPAPQHVTMTLSIHSGENDVTFTSTTRRPSTSYQILNFSMKSIKG